MAGKRDVGRAWSQFASGEAGSTRLGAGGEGLGAGLVEAKFGALEEGGQFAEALLELFEFVGTHGDVAELAARAGRFAVKMQMCVGDTEHFVHFGQFANEIDHGGKAHAGCGTERHVENGAEMIFELAGGGAFDGPVAGIVDAGSDFVGEERVADLEQLEADDAGVIEGFENFAGVLLGGFL